MQSLNNTLTGYGQAITDAQGNVWTITADRRVAVNGVPDPTTADVTHLAYANGLVWQENTSNLWFANCVMGSALWDLEPSGPGQSVARQYVADRCRR